ncbi:MAG: FdtA/QdtA family cupin domain-containing protein [Bacteroides sp.]|nr:FdtA/QdtA family cupin domain-containing protein [Lachnospiraceae bacterium]MCM1333182.1 FdtA/QdtA family cupin domain-containing protein [Bacteroides sp.]MCM1390099.1 FdtA/QdtA family cupin domain-containing protein [Bacteroides sp.]
MKLDEIKLIELPKIEDARGNLSFIQAPDILPFELKRTYWIYDVAGGNSRKGHAFRQQEEVIVALSGSFDVVLDDGEKQRRYHLCRSYYGLYVPKMIWRVIDNFSTNSVALVLSSTNYDESDYIRDYAIFQNEKISIS